MNTLVTATQRLSQPCGPLPVNDCRVCHEGNDNGIFLPFSEEET